MKILIAGVPSAIWLGAIIALTTFTNDYLSAYPWATYVLTVLGVAGIALKTYIERQGAIPVAPTDYSGLNPAATPQYVPQKSFVREWLFGG